jgi:CRP/FNR family transcriptional regulator
MGNFSKKMKNILDVIAQTPLFSGLPDHQLQALRKIAVPRRFEKGEVVFSEGQPGNGFFVTMSGRVKIFKVSAEGKEQILHIFGPGEPFGEVPVFSGKPFPASAEAIAASQLLFFPKQAFIALVSDTPSLALNMLAVLSMRLRQFTVQIENLSLKEVPGRLASYLIYLTAEQNAADTVALTISKGQLASLLGTIPETLSRIFNKMGQQRLISVDGGRIGLLNRDALEDLAAGARLEE